MSIFRVAARFAVKLKHKSAGHIEDMERLRQQIMSGKSPPEPERPEPVIVEPPPVQDTPVEVVRRRPAPGQVEAPRRPMAEPVEQRPVPPAKPLPPEARQPLPAPKPPPRRIVRTPDPPFGQQPVTPPGLSESPEAKPQPQPQPQPKPKPKKKRKSKTKGKGKGKGEVHWGEDEPLEYGSPEYHELAKIYTRQPAVENMQEAITAFIRSSVKENTAPPDIVDITLEGSPHGIWIYDSGIERYRRAAGGVGSLEIPQKELTKALRELHEKQEEPPWRSQMYAEEEAQKQTDEREAEIERLTLELARLQYMTHTEGVKKRMETMQARLDELQDEEEPDTVRTPAPALKLFELANKFAPQRILREAKRVYQD